MFFVFLFCFYANTSNLYSQSSNQNYIKTTTPVSAVTTETALNSLPTSSKVENITYFDGLGRTIQTVSKRSSPLSKDMVQNIIYDQYGRTPRNYLPYVDATVDGSYKTNATADQAAFYTNTFMVAHTTTPYGDAVYDGSPLNKVQGTSAPDADWQPGQHTTEIQEKANAANEVRLWQITGGDCISSSFYAANQLSKVKVTDPNGGYSYTFTDKLGQTVMVQRYIRSISKSIHVFAYTYYVYDDFGNLSYVISPKANDLMNTSTVYSVNALSEDLVFKYIYDERHRLVEKKTPGADWQYIVYNQLNQPVLTQDGNLRAQNKWNFIKYDVLGRAILTGLFNASSLPLYQTRASAQAQLNANQADIGESEVPQDVSNPYGYTNITLPYLNLDILTVNFYDDYDFDNTGGADYTFNSGSMPCITTGSVVCTPFSVSSTNRTRGFLTGTKTKVLDAGNPVQWITAASFYNADGEMVQVQSNDHLGGSYLTNMRYDYSGNLIHSVLKYTDVASTVTQIINYFTYDKMGRLMRVDQKNNNDAPVLLSKARFNELGQQVDKDLHSTNNGLSFIQSIDYRYNIHGWLTHINNSDLSNDMGVTNPETGLPPADGTNDDDGDLWGMQLKYNTVTTGISATTAKQFSGNVSEKHWKSKSDNVKRAYSYTYDKMDRLLSSTYTEHNGTTWGTNLNRFNENEITYDANGNILTLNRYGLQSGTTYGMIDALDYAYSGNQVTAITDYSAVNSSIANDFNDNGSTGISEYSYDANGNLTSNTNKQITGISYNHMNLPTLIQFSNGNKIEYFYDATGTRLRKKMTKVTSPAGVTNKKYTGPFEYTDTGLEAIYTSEGRCVPSGVSSPAFNYEYNYMDNTGNVTMCFSDADNDGLAETSEILQQSHYYPFGMRIGIVTGQTGPENKYKFGGKEMQDEFGLNEYDFGARFYDPAIGRWGCVDPMADRAPDWTPFRYGFNNPLRYTDPTGMSEQDEFEGGEWADKRKEGDKGKSLRDGSSQTFTGSVVQKESGLTPIKVDPIKAEQMQMIAITSLDISKLSPELRAMNQAPTRQDKLEADVPDFYDAYAEAGDMMSNRGFPIEGAIMNMSYGATNDLVKSYNWIVNREMRGIQGYTIGRKEAQDASFMTAISILSLPLGALGELAATGEIGSRQAFNSFRAFKRAYGRAGDGIAWHHVVEQTPGNVSKFGAQNIHNTRNLIKLQHGKGTIHARISGYYSSKDFFTGGQTVRQWLSTQSFQQQFEFGMKILFEYGWKP
jgi:RHS repeat-associated protein